MFLFHVCYSFSQVWPKYYTQNNSYDYSEDIIEMYDNGYLMAGNYSSYDGPDYKTWSWLIKTDINGNKIWDKIIEGGDQIMGTSAVEHSKDGGILTCGAIWTAIGNYDPYVMKLNACGEKEWCKIFVGSTETNPYAQDVKEAASGEIIVLVNQFGDYNSENMDLFKLNSEGDLLWKKTYCNGYEYPEAALPLGLSLNITSNDEYCISGSVYWEDPWNPGGPKGLRPLFVSIDSLGNENWVLPFGLQDTILGGALSSVEFSNDLFIGVGYAFANEGYDEGLIMGFDGSGNITNYNKINAKEIDTNFNRVLFYDAKLLDTLVAFGGVMGVESSGNPSMETISDTNFFNNILFYKSKQHTNLTTPYSLCKTSNKLLSNSTFRETGNWDIALSKLNLNLEYDTLDTGSYTYDSLCTTPGLPQSGFIFLDDCELITGIDVPSPEQYYAHLKTIPLSVYPNPAKDIVNFTMENTEHHKDIVIRCFNLLGKPLIEIHVISGQKEAGALVSGWPQGMYVAVVYSMGLPVGECKFVVE